jgi:parallel beta-helix repeat protein
MDKGWIFLIFSFFILIPFFARAQDFDKFLEMPSIPGHVEGKGNHFEIKNSDYLNISLESSEEISVILESIPKTISLNIIESSSNSTILTLKGLEPNKTYFKYQDSYKEEAVFISDENGIYSWQQDLTEPHYIWIQEEKGTIFLTRDCSKYGNWETSTQTCTLTEDVTNTIEIDANNVTLDCNGHQIKNEYWISGPILTHGIYAYQKRGVKIKNCNVAGFDYSLFLSYSSENEVLKNNISKSHGGGILIQFSNSNQIFENKVSDSLRQGMMIVFSNNNQLKGNRLENNGYNFGIVNTKIEGYVQDIDTSNTINGKPIYYLVGQENTTIEAADNPGYIGIINSKNIEIKNVSLLEPNYQQVLFINSQDSKIEESQIQNGVVAGIQILFSSNIEILKNKISNCYYAIYASTIIGAEGKTLENGLISENELTENGGGIGFINAFGNKILKNKISKNNPGIYFTNSSNNVISENTISENEYGAINLILSSDNTLKGNNILNNGEGILLSGSSNNIIFENSISKQKGQWGRGIYLSGTYTQEGLVKSENNKIYHNNFIQNKVNAKVESDYASGNFFDNGYQSGGNFWSDYQGKDENGDGIGDTPYCFQGGCDNYPFMAENGWQFLKEKPKVLISEVYFNPDSLHGATGTNEWMNEWIELRNLEDREVDISGWTIRDNNATTIIPNSSIIPRKDLPLLLLQILLLIFGLKFRKGQ